MSRRATMFVVGGTLGAVLLILLVVNLVKGVFKPKVTEIASLSDVQENLGVYMDERVVFKSTISTWVTKNSFIVSDASFRNRGILVVSRQPFSEELKKDSEVVIEGSIKPLDIKDMDLLGLKEVKRSVLYNWQDSLVIIADKVEKV